MSVIEKMDNVGHSVGNAVSSVGNFAAGVGTGIKTAVKTGVEEGKGRIQSRRLAGNVPNESKIIDAFNRKLFNYADFDYLIKYLRDNNLSTCKNIYSLDSLANELSEQVRSALVHRSVGGLPLLFRATLRLCVRKRKGLLAYVDLKMHVCKKLVKWETFCEYAGFADPKSASEIWLPTEELFPMLKRSKASKRVNADTENAQTNEQEPVVGATAHDQTGMFTGQQSVNYAQILVLLYNQAVQMSSSLRLNESNAVDALLCFAAYYKGGAAEVKQISDIEASIQQLFQWYKVQESLKDIAAMCNGNILSSFRSLWKLPEGSGEGNTIVLDILSKAFYRTFSPEDDFVAQYYAQADALKDEVEKAITGSEFRRVSDFPVDAEVLIRKHNEDLFAAIYDKVTSGENITPTDADISDVIMCTILYHKYKTPFMSLEQYSTLVEREFNKMGITSQTFMRYLVESEYELLPAVMCFRDVRNIEDAQSGTLLRSLLSMACSELELPSTGITTLQQVYAAYKAKQAADTTGMTQRSARDMFI